MFNSVVVRFLVNCWYPSPVQFFLFRAPRDPRRYFPVSWLWLWLSVKVKVTIRLAVYYHSVRHCVKPLENFFQLNLCGNNPYLMSSLTRRLGCLLWICLAFIKGRYRTYNTLLKTLPFALYSSSLSSDFAKQIMPILRILCYNGSLVTRMAVSLTTAKFKPLIFSMSRFTLSYTMNMTSGCLLCNFVL
jgi:hypothetical protein